MLYKVDRTRADAAASLSQQLCSGHGIFSVQLPYDFHPKPTPRPCLGLISAMSRLHLGHISAISLQVQLPYDFYPKPADCLPSSPRSKLEECYNQHKPRCRCLPGWAGTNCETRMEEARHLHKCLNECSGRGECVHNFCRCKEGSWGADCSLGEPGGSMPPLPLQRGAAPARPRIYVYDLPPRFTSWLSAYRKGDWTHDHWYGVDAADAAPAAL